MSSVKLMNITMDKQVSVTFVFNSETETVSDLHCFVDGIEKKKTTTRSRKPKGPIVLEDKAIVTLESNKLVFNNRCVADMQLEWENRVIVKYEKFEDGKKLIPVVGKDTSWDEEGSGNKVTKTNTVSYRGKSNTILQTYGTEFELELWKEGLWKLVSISGGENTPTYEGIVEETEKLDVTVITDEGNEEIPIDEMTFKL